ncbi:MAG: YhjD/YihY/BrkB family envelope integrity protein [Ghiorsea sp.]
MLKLLFATHKHFLRAQGMQFASALSYSTLLSVVPITVLLFYISIQTELFSSLFDQVREQLLTQLLPTSREQVESYLLETTKNIKSFSYLSLAIVFLSAIWLSLGVERAFNHIWQITSPRTLVLRIPAHITLWLVTPVLIMLSITLSTWMISLPYIHGFAQYGTFFSKFLPLMISSVAFFLLYFFVPNTQVNLKSAAIAGFSAGLLFEFSKWGFTIYITQYAMYEKLYGALATLPVFMLWVFISWLIILWGASFTHILQKQGH